MDINSLKNIKPGSNLPKKIIAVLVSVIVVIASFSYLNSVNSDAKEFVEIVVIKPSVGIPAKNLITESIIQKGKILKTDFKNGMVTYDKIDEVLNKYSLYFLRNDTPLYFDQLTETKPVRHEWLYSLPKESEVLTVPYEYEKCGGEVLIPGDHVRVRITYEDVNAQSASPDVEQNAYMSTGSPGRKNLKTEVLFDKILVKDMLNSKGHSINEVFKEVSELGEEEKQAAMSSKDFVQSVLAKSLVFEASPQQVEKYAQSNVNSATFTFTILSREGNEKLIEQLPTVEKEVKAWANSSKKE